MSAEAEPSSFRRHIAQVEMHVLRLERRLKTLQEESEALNQRLVALNVDPLRLPTPSHEDFDRAAHVGFLLAVDDDRETALFAQTEHLRMQGAFWTFGGIDMLDAWAPAMKKKSRKANIEWVLSCFDRKRGGFGGNTGHDANLLYTQHAVYVLLQLDALEVLDQPHSSEKSEEARLSMRDRVVAYVRACQLPSGAFKGEPEWEEVDTRFSYCAGITLAVLNALDAVDQNKAVEFILSTRNELDGGFGCSAGVESHSGYVFTALAALSVFRGLDRVRSWDSLAWWLSERQCDSGGLNGRPEKLADVCYTFWTLSSLWTLGRLEWIDKARLIRFVKDCRDPEVGGYGDHPGNCADVYHTFFALAGLGILGCFDESRGGEYASPSWRFNAIHPVYALPARLVEEMKLPCQIVRDGVFVNM